MSGSPYTFLFADLVTNKVIEELPLTGVDFTTVFNGAGPFKGSLNLGDSKVQNLNWSEALEPGRTVIYVDRGGTIVWGGVLWQTDYEDDKYSIGVNASEFYSYYQARRMNYGYPFPPWVWTNQDLYKIVRDVFAFCANDAYTLPITVLPASPAITGILYSLVVYGYELRKASEVIDQLMKLQNGFDFYTWCQWVNGQPQKYFQMGWPHLGRLAAVSGLVFEKPGNILKYKWPRDGTQGPITDLWVSGAGTGNASQISYSANSDLLTAGYPHLSDTISRPEIRDSATLNSYSAQLASIRRVPVTLPTITINPAMDPILGTWEPGDWCRVRILDEYFPAPGIDTYFRIDRTQIKPGDDGHEEVTLTLGTA